MGGLANKDNNGRTKVQDHAMCPQDLQIVVGLVERLAQEFVNNIVASLTQVGELVNKSLHLSMLRKMNMRLAWMSVIHKKTWKHWWWNGSALHKLSWPMVILNRGWFVHEHKAWAWNLKFKVKAHYGGGHFGHFHNVYM